MENQKENKIPWWKGLIYALLLIVVILAFTFFLIIRSEIEIPPILDTIIWIVFAGIGIFAYAKKNIKIGK